MENIITACVVFAISLVLFVLSVRSFKEKGFLFNNAYIYASRTERASMDKKPHYRQTAIVFLLLGLMFLLMGLEALLDTGWLLWVEILCMAVALVYAIASSVVEATKR